MLKLDMARDAMPDITVSTDIIVGFCGESIAQFEHTRDALTRGQFDMAFIAQYSPRPGAVAERRFPDDVPREEKKRRHIELTTVLAHSATKNNNQLVGRTIPVLVETSSRKQGKLLGRTEGLKSIEFDATPHATIGEFVDVTITHCDAWRLFGTVAAITATPANPQHDIPALQHVDQVRQ